MPTADLSSLSDSATRALMPGYSVALRSYNSSHSLVILSNGGDDTGRQHREAQIPQTGLFYSAARFRIIEGSPAPAEWLEVFETDDSHPLHAYPRVTSNTPPASQIQPQLSQSFRLRACPAARQ